MDCQFPCHVVDALIAFNNNAAAFFYPQLREFLRKAEDPLPELLIGYRLTVVSKTQLVRLGAGISCDIFDNRMIHSKLLFFNSPQYYSLFFIFFSEIHEFFT